jgi:AbrB family looped-hinge helix DNA binding protein
MFPKFAGAVTVGERGQIVIPAEVRAQLLIGPGDKVLVFY